MIRRRGVVFTALVIALVVVVIITLNLGFPAERATTQYFAMNTPAVIAHQGGDGLRPGNTLLAFDHAVSLGVDVLEMDVHQSRDGVLVVMHDATVDRTTNGTGALVDLDYSSIRALDAAFHWPFDGSAPYRGQGVTVPALDEVLKRYAGKRFNIEIKQAHPSIGLSLCRLLRETQHTEHVLIASFHRGAMQDFRAACPEVATSAHRYEVMGFVLAEALGLSRWQSPVAHTLQVPLAQWSFALTDVGQVSAAHRLGLRVDAWTLNDAKAIEAAIARGVDGVITDRPDLALAIRGSQINGFDGHSHQGSDAAQDRR